MIIKPSAIIQVSTYNCPKYLRNFSKSFMQNTIIPDDIDIFIDVQNDDPRYNSWDYLDSSCGHMWECRNDKKNLFYGGRRNVMIDSALSLIESKDDLIFLFDDDMQFVDKNWLSYCFKIMKAYPEVGILGLHWPRLKDGKTRQAHHAPIETLYAFGVDPIHKKNFISGNCWVCRPEALMQVGHFITAKTREEWKAQSPGPDTEYHNRMLKETNFILASTTKDLVYHAGLEEMR